MEQNLDNLKQKTLKELTSLKDKVSKIQHKIYDKEKPEPIINEYGIPEKVAIAYAITPKTMANIPALESALKFYQEKGQTALETVKKSRFLSGDYFKNYSISRSCNKVVSNIQKMIDSVKTFNAKKAKLAPKKEETQAQEVQNKSTEVVEEKADETKVKEEPVIPVNEDKNAKDEKSTKNTIENEKALSQDNSSTTDNTNVNVETKETENKSNESSKENVMTTKTTQISKDELSDGDNNDSKNNSNSKKANETKTKEEISKNEIQKGKDNSIAINKDEFANEPTDAINAVKDIDESEFGEPDYNVLEDSSDEYNVQKDEVPQNNATNDLKEEKNQNIGAPEEKTSSPTNEDAKNDNSNQNTIQNIRISTANRVQTVQSRVIDIKPEQDKTISSTALIPTQKTMFPVVINPEKPCILDGIEQKYYKNIFKLLNTTIIIGNKNQYNSLENLEYELSNASLETMQNLGFPVLDDPQKADLIKNVMLKLVKMSKEIRKDQWLSNLNANKKGTFEARKHTNQEAIVDRNLKLIKELNINPKLAQEYGLSLSVSELKQTIKEEKAEARKGMKKVASENNRDIKFINFYNTFKNIHILGNAKDKNSLYYLYTDLTSENNSFGLTGDSLTVALNLVKQEIISTRNSKQSKANTTKTSEKEENTSTDVLGK